MTESRRPKISTHIGLRRELLDAVGSLMTQARSTLFITGPGLSADSGLTHYRGMPGLLRKTSNERAGSGGAGSGGPGSERLNDGRLFEVGLSIDTLTRKPSTTWSYLLEMDARVRAAEPNRGHEVIAQLERDLPRVTVMTVNVDRLHQRAGSRNVIEMHGALHDLLCSRCEITTRHTSFAGLDMPPRCRSCDRVLRPDMPLFGEPLPADPFTRLQAELDLGFDLVLMVGVVTMFPYVARPLLLAKSDGVPTVEIGSQSTDVSDLVDFRFRGSPMRVLDLLADVYTTIRRRSQP